MKDITTKRQIGIVMKVPFHIRQIRQIWHIVSGYTDTQIIEAIKKVNAKIGDLDPNVLRETIKGIK